jgi:hypothetical protein
VAILDRAYGKPTQALEHSSPDNSLERLMAELEGMSFRPVEFPRMCTMARALGKEVELDTMPECHGGVARCSRDSTKLTKAD